jgi:hypothetical protein
MGQESFPPCQNLNFEKVNRDCAEGYAPEGSQKLRETVEAARSFVFVKKRRPNRPKLLDENHKAGIYWFDRP